MHRLRWHNTTHNKKKQNKKREAEKQAQYKNARIHWSVCKFIQAPRTRFSVLTHISNAWLPFFLPPIQYFSYLIWYLGELFFFSFYFPILIS